MASAARNVRLPPLPTIRDLVKLYRLRAIRQLSQNFLMDERLTDKIVRAAGWIQNGFVCEVGPGPGGITRSIIRRGPKELVVVEKDPRFLPTLELLAEASQHTQMKIEIGDIMSYNLEGAFPGAPRVEWDAPPPPMHLIGNLPFSVSTHLIIRWLNAVSERRSAWVHGRTRMTLTFQKEVAERMAAPVLHKQRCRLSVMCQFWCHVNHIFTIPGTAFVPRPEVDVSVVTLTPLKDSLVPNLPFKMVEKVVRQVFNMRQKYAIRGGQTLFPKGEGELAMRMFHLADVDPTTRPFQISNEEFARICYAYKVICDDNPAVLDYDFRAPKNVNLV